MDTVRHSTLGSLLRLISSNRILPYPEQVAGFEWPHRHARTERLDSDATLAGPDPHPEKIAPLAHAGGEMAAGAAIQGELESEHHPHLKDSEKGPSSPASPAESEIDPTVVTWYGDDDPENPQNWPLSRKLAITAVFGIYTSTVYICSAIYTPGIELLMDEFGATLTEATLGLTLFVLGYSTATLVLTPITMRPATGRRDVYVISFLLYGLFLIGSAGVRNLPGFLVFRLLSGLAGSPGVSTVGVSLSDFWAPLTAPRAMAIWGSFATLGPVLGPLIGAAAIEHPGWGTWRSPLWLLAAVTAFSFLLVVAFMPETSATAILHRRMLRLKKVTGRTDLRTEWQKAGLDISVWGTITSACKVALDPSVAYVCAQIALVYSCLYGWFECFPTVYGAYGFTSVEQGAVYLFIGVGVGLTVVGYVAWLILYFEPSVKTHGMRPEVFIGPGYIAVVALPACLLWFGWSANRTHWVVPSIATMLFAPGAFLAFMSGLNYLAVGFFPVILPIFVLNAISRGLVAAFVPLYADPAIQAIGIGWWCTILAAVSLFMIPIPFLLQFKGKALRARSKFATPAQ